MTPDRLAELVDKVSHGHNLSNSEAREVFEHFGVAVEERKRCQACGGNAGVKWLAHVPCKPGPFVIECEKCNGCGYEVRK